MSDLAIIATIVVVAVAVIILTKIVSSDRCHNFSIKISQNGLTFECKKSK